MFLLCFKKSNHFGKCSVCDSKLKSLEKCHICESFQAKIRVSYVHSFSEMLNFSNMNKINYSIHNDIKSDSIYDYLLLIHWISYNSAPELKLVPRILNIFGRAKLPENVYIPTVFLTDYVQYLVKYINQLSGRSKTINWELEGAILALDQFHKINNLTGNKIPVESFVCTMLQLYLDVKRDFRNYKKNNFNVLQFAYMLPAGLKFKYLELESDRVSRTRFHYPRSLTIHRESLISDSKNQLQKIKLSRKLRVEFADEEGIDAGGIIREWSMQVTDYLAPFCFENNWISESADPTNMELLGTIFGLSLFNGTVLNTNLPAPFFKMLLGLEITETDFEFLFPQQMRHLRQFQQSRNMDDFDEYFGCMTFCRNYSRTKSTKNDDHSNCHALVKNGHSLYINKSNLEAYVDAYKQSLLYSMNNDAFKAFHKGFWKLLPCKKYVNNLFSCLELKSILQGDDKFDLTPLRDVCIFDYSLYPVKQVNSKYPLSKFIRDFWEILLNDFSIEQKKKFLRFTTGCDRICQTRMCNIKEYDKRGFFFRVSISGTDSDHLPIAHTCILLLT